MPHHATGSSTIALALSLAATAAWADGKKGRYSDERYGFTLTVPAPWSEAPLANYTVPGVARAAWEGPQGASVVAFMQEPGRAFSPRFLVDASARAYEEKLGAKVAVRDVRTVGGKQAMWMVATGPGTGGAIAPGGSVETTQHWVAIPREKDIVIFLLTCRASEYEGHREGFEQAVGSAEVRGSQTAEQAGSK